MPRTAPLPRRLATIVLAGLVVPLTGPPASAAPAAPGPHRALRAIVENGGIGAVAEVAMPGRTWRLAEGRASVKPRRTASPSARFRAGSVTKQLVAVLALQLVADGRWSLRTTLGDVLPRLWPERSDVTLRQLLSHTSGMPDFIVPLLADATTPRQFLRAITRPRSDRELVRAARTQPWGFEPGADWGYSNTNYVVVGMMLRRATGSPLPRLVRERVLDPARMTRSELARDRRMAPPRLREYARLEGKRRDLRRFHPTIYSSAGALVSTARDLNRFHRALSRGTLLPDRLVRRMRSVVAVDEASGLRYGLGSYRLPDPCRPGRFVHGHDGATWGTYTFSFASPDGKRRVTVAATGRHLNKRGRPLAEVAAFVTSAFEATCSGGSRSLSSRRGLDRWPTPVDPGSTWPW